MKIKNLKQAADLSTSGNDYNDVEANLKIEVNGAVWHCYNVSISYREIFCNCDKGSAVFVVDTYGDRNTFELYDWENEE